LEDREITGNKVMKPTKTLLKLGAVLSSTALMGAFVAYQAGVFNGIRATSTPPAPAVNIPTSQKDLPSTQVDPANQTSVDVKRAQQPAPTPQNLDPTLMSGSKSFSPQNFLQGLTPVSAPPSAAPQPQAPPPPAPSPMLLPSSKSNNNIIDLQRTVPARPTPPQSKKSLSW
jgi:hypothetical protein